MIRGIKTPAAYVLAHLWVGVRRKITDNLQQRVSNGVQELVKGSTYLVRGNAVRQGLFDTVPSDRADDEIRESRFQINKEIEHGDLKWIVYIKISQRHSYYRGHDTHRCMHRVGNLSPKQ